MVEAQRQGMLDLASILMHKPPSVIVKKQPTIYVTHPREGVNNEI
jgi:hypothetical protein